MLMILILYVTYLGTDDHHLKHNFTILLIIQK